MCEQTARVFIFVVRAKTTKNGLADERVEALTGALSAEEIVCDAPRVFVASRLRRERKGKKEKGREGERGRERVFWADGARRFCIAEKCLEELHYRGRDYNAFSRRRDAGICHPELSPGC